MNKKRQTIWLVSMLSIMVVLSAYYLFTGDPEQDKLDTASDNSWNNVVIDMLNDGDYDFALNPDLDNVLDGTGHEGSLQDDEEAGHEHSSGSIYDQDAIAVSGAEYFLSMEMAMEDFFAQEIERLHEIANNPEHTNLEVVSALEQIETLRSQQEKMDNIEVQLAQHYERAVVLQQQEDKWQVVVQTDKLEKSEALSIIDLVMSELNVGPASVSVAIRQ